MIVFFSEIACFSIILDLVFLYATLFCTCFSFQLYLVFDVDVDIDITRTDYAAASMIINQAFKELVYEKVKEIHITRFPYNDFLFQKYDELTDNE